VPDLLAQELSTDAIRRLHKFAPFLRLEPGPTSEIAIFHHLTLWNAANLPTFIDEVEGRSGKTATT
jgi:hypothetical protein